MKKFKQESTEKCRNCKGTGRIGIEEYGRVKTISCPICNGSGYVKKTIEGTVTITPSERPAYRMKKYAEMTDVEKTILENQERFG